jgi:hypothetical protein
MIPQRDDVSPAGVAPISGYTAMDIQQFKSDHFSFAPFRKSFDEVYYIIFVHTSQSIMHLLNQ